METKKWEALLTAVELGSFTRAAEKLGCTQSGLTHMMNSLEGEVGFPLLVRDRYGVRLTTAGERLLLFDTGMANIRDVIPFPRTPKSAEF